MILLQIPKLGSQDPCGWLAILVPWQPYPPGPWIFLVTMVFFILKSLNHPLLCGYDMNLYLDIGTWDHQEQKNRYLGSSGAKKIGTWYHQGQKKISTWDHQAHRGLAKSHTASGSPAVQRLFLMSQKYYFLRKSATRSPNDILRWPTKKAPQNSTH